MKKLKLFALVIAVLISSNLIFAGNSTSVSGDSIPNLMNNDSTSKSVVENMAKPDPKSVDDISAAMVEHLDKDVMLTSTQKDKLKKLADEYSANLLKARAMSNKAESYVFMKTVTNNYKAAEDNILTPDQKMKREKKQKEKIEILITKQKNNKSKQL